MPQRFVYGFNGEFGWQLWLFMPYVYAQVLRCGEDQSVHIVGCKGDRPLYECLNVSYEDGLTRCQMEGTEMFSTYPGVLPFPKPWPLPFDTALEKSVTAPDPSWWVPPDFKSYWEQKPVDPRLGLTDDRPIVVVANKYSHFPAGYGGLERGMLEPNYLPLDTLDHLIRRLVKTHQVVYSRIRFAVDLQTVLDINDDGVARAAGAVVLSDYVDKGDLEAWNRLLLPVYARAACFTSVQGGVSYLASCFGGKNLILTRRGIETRKKFNGQRFYDYFGRLSDAQIKWTGNDDEFLELAKSWLI